MENLSGIIVFNFQESWKHLFFINRNWEVDMDKNDLKRLLAGLSIAGLIAGTGLSVTGCATA